MKTRPIEAPNDQDKKRIRVLLNDGINTFSAAMMVLDKDAAVPEDNNVIQVNTLTSRLQRLNDKVVWILYDFEVISRSEGKIGDPVPFKIDASVLSSNDERTPERPSSSTGSAQPPSKRPRPNETAATPMSNLSPEFQRPGGSFSHVRRQLFGSTSHAQNGSDSDDRNVMQPTHQIKDLNPYQNKFKIKARVVKKGDLRSWSNSRGQGQVFDLTLKDSSGEIKATGFNEEAARFHPLFEEDRVYVIETATIKPANKNFNKTDHNYELSFHKGTLVTQCLEATSSEVPRSGYTLKTINDVNQEGTNAGDSVDVLGVVIDVGDVHNFTSKGGKDLTKREVRLVDNSGAQGLSTICLTLWGEKAESFDSTNHHKVILSRGSNVGEWQSKINISLGFSGTVVVDPPGCEEADQLRAWFLRENSATEGGIAGKLGDSSRSTHRVSSGTLVTLADIKAVSAGMESPQVFTLEAQFKEVQTDRLMYKACPECKKKVVEVSDTIRCERCNKNLDQVDHRYFAQAMIVDFTDYSYVTLWNDGGEAAFGCPAKELRRLEEDEYAVFVARVNQVKFKPFKMTVKAANDTYQNERRLKIQVLGMEPVNRTCPERLRRMRSEIMVLNSNSYVDDILMN